MNRLVHILDWGDFQLLKITKPIQDPYSQTRSMDTSEIQEEELIAASDPSLQVKKKKSTYFPQKFTFFSLILRIL